MKLRTRQDYFGLYLQWSALDDNTYDIDNHMIGYGDTEHEAVADLMRLLQEKAECEEERRFISRPAPRD